MFHSDVVSHWWRCCCSLVVSSLEVAWYTRLDSLASRPGIRTGTEERETSPRGKKQTSVSCFDAKNKKIFIFWWQSEIFHVLMKNCFFLCLYAKIRHFSCFCEKWIKFFMFWCKKEETFYDSMLKEDIFYVLKRKRKSLSHLIKNCFCQSNCISAGDYSDWLLTKLEYIFTGHAVSNFNNNLIIYAFTNLTLSQRKKALFIAKVQALLLSLTVWCNPTSYTTEYPWIISWSKQH